jgi:hypothetical protein
MKTLNIIFITLFFSISLSAQTYSSDLETVYLNSGLAVEVEVDEFASENMMILDQEEFNIRKEIRKERGEHNFISFKSNLDQLHVERLDYLVLLRKAANRSENSSAFGEYLINSLPQLENSLIHLSELDRLYLAVRRDTFNGRLEALPFVL